MPIAKDTTFIPCSYSHALFAGTKTKVEVLTISDIEKEYLLVRAKLSLIQREPTLTTQLASEYL